MQDTLTISRIDAAATLPLRQAVLWPDYPLSASKVTGDESALHFGGHLGERLVTTASLFAEGPEVRLRKFATDTAHQGKGYGAQMLEHLLVEARDRGFHSFWMDARESALPFYARFGFRTEGARFYKRQIPYFKMTRPL